MSEQTAGLYNEPGPDMIDKYVQLADGKWYPRESTEVNSVSGRINPDGSVEIFDEVAVGDLNSDAKGSGARKNSNKPQVDLIPIRFWFERFCMTDYANQHPEVMTSVQALAEFQEGRCNGQELLTSLPTWMIWESVPVWEYGADKYAAWNWLKGMPWSVPTGCAIRHLVKMILDHEQLDDESGCTHAGHYACNVQMLSAYYRWYPEGNDMPKEAYFNAG